MAGPEVPQENRTATHPQLPSNPRPASRSTSISLTQAHAAHHRSSVSSLRPIRLTVVPESHLLRPPDLFPLLTARPRSGHSSSRALVIHFAPSSNIIFARHTNFRLTSLSTSTHFLLFKLSIGFRQKQGALFLLRWFSTFHGKSLEAIPSTDIETLRFTRAPTGRVR